MANKKNYNKMSTEKVKVEATEVIEETSVVVPEVAETVVEDTVVETVPEKKIKIGVVTNCEKLNVRTNPHPTAHVELVINKGTEVEIVRSEGDFYFVRKDNTTNGFNGWCMKKYISVK